MDKDELYQALQRKFGVNADQWMALLAAGEHGSVNLYQEVAMRSRTVDVQRDSSLLVQNVQLHSHTFYEIICCCQGSIQYLLGSRRYRVGRGDILFIPPGTGHRPLLAPDMPQSYDRYVMWLSREYADHLRRRYPDVARFLTMPPMLLRTGGPAFDRVAQTFAAAIREEEQQEPGWEAAVTGATLQLLVQFSRLLVAAGTLPPAEQPELLDRVLSYVETHLGDKITLADTARQFLVSESTVSQLFRQRMGTSFYRCVTQRRLIEAKARIAAGDTLEEVARGVGFGDYSAFYRAFRQEFGVSPARYRRL